jgi:hypothetical protein
MNISKTMKWWKLNEFNFIFLKIHGKIGNIWGSKNDHDKKKVYECCLLVEFCDGRKVEVWLQRPKKLIFNNLFFMKTSKKTL